MTEQSLPLQLKTNSTLRKAFPFIVILPSCPWSCAQKNEWHPNIMQRTTKVINEVATRYNGDFNRVSLAGQSMGGNGAWEYASSQKGLFSAVVAICGYLRSNLYEDHEIAKRLRLPIWVTGLSTRAQARHPFCMQLNIVRHIYLVVILIGILVVRSSTRRTMS